MSGHHRFTTAIAVLLFAAPLAAQDVSQNVTPVVIQAPVAAPSSVVELAPSLAPTMANAAVAVRAHSTAVTPVSMQTAEDRQRSPAMMIVGGAALLVGAVVGGNAGTIVMIAGGVIGLVGLWNYLM